jgi:tetratricopeptide (TPR) repeat protein
MNRLSSRYCSPVLFAFLLASSSLAQQSGSSGSGSGSSGSGSSGSKGSGSSTTTQPGGAVSTPPGQTPGAYQPQYQSPLYVNGRILMDNGQPVPESVSVALECPAGPLQVIHTDLKGYFQFALGGGLQGNEDFSASNSAQMPVPGGGIQTPGGGNGQFGHSQRILTGCEVQVSIAGYVPLTKTITDQNDITGIDVGTLHLSRLAGVSGTSISVTSLQVPNDARKEFEKGEKDVRSHHLDSATQHLQNAVGQYDKYAAAWNELGTLYVASHENEKARQAFEKSIAADPHYIPPDLGLAQLELQNKEYERAVESAGKALELDSSIGVADLIQAIGDFNLNRLDAAKKSAELAEKGPHQNLPDLHALHAQILLEKQDYAGAAAQMRAYLKEVPQGRFADEMKKGLQQIAQPVADGGAKSDSAQIAP